MLASFPSIIQSILTPLHKSHCALMFSAASWMSFSILYIITYSTVCVLKDVFVPSELTKNQVRTLFWWRNLINSAKNALFVLEVAVIIIIIIHSNENQFCQSFLPQHDIDWLDRLLSIFCRMKWLNVVCFLEIFRKLYRGSVPVSSHIERIPVQFFFSIFSLFW